jgi:uncharacterized protein (TIGR02246 family)
MAVYATRKTIMTNDDQHAADKAAIIALDAAWGAAVGRRDLEAVLDLYADDGTLAWPGEPAIHGMADIRPAWVAMLQTPGLSLNFTSERIDVAGSGEIAADFGKVEFGHDTDTGHAIDIGKYVVTWVKRDGKWKVLYDIFNTDS